MRVVRLGEICHLPDSCYLAIGSKDSENSRWLQFKQHSDRQSTLCALRCSGGEQKVASRRRLSDGHIRANRGKNILVIAVIRRATFAALSSASQRAAAARPSCARAAARRGRSGPAHGICSGTLRSHHQASAANCNDVPAGTIVAHETRLTCSDCAVQPRHAWGTATCGGKAFNVAGYSPFAFCGKYL